jgi:hypothetical protein
MACQDGGDGKSSDNRALVKLDGVCSLFRPLSEWPVYTESTLKVGEGSERV